jgi:anti-sigma B factor antagonist
LRIADCGGSADPQSAHLQSAIRHAAHPRSTRRYDPAQMRLSAPFEVTLEERGEVVHVILRGELDISTATRLEESLERIEADQPELVVIDLSGLEFMDSTGLRLLISADQRARDAGRRLVLVQGNDMVQRVLRLTRLDERLEIVPDRAAVA